MLVHRWLVTCTVRTCLLYLLLGGGLTKDRSGVVLVGEDVEEGNGLGDGELEPELGPVVVVEDGAEGVLLQRVVDPPRRHANLRIETISISISITMIDVE